MTRSARRKEAQPPDLPHSGRRVRGPKPAALAPRAGSPGPPSAGPTCPDACQGLQTHSGLRLSAVTPRTARSTSYHTFKTNWAQEKLLRKTERMRSISRLSRFLFPGRASRRKRSAGHGLSGGAPTPPRGSPPRKAARKGCRRLRAGKALPMTAPAGVPGEDPPTLGAAASLLRSPKPLATARGARGAGQGAQSLQPAARPRRRLSLPAAAPAPPALPGLRRGQSPGGGKGARPRRQPRTRAGANGDARRATQAHEGRGREAGRAIRAGAQGPDGKREGPRAAEAGQRRSAGPRAEGEGRGRPRALGTGRAEAGSGPGGGRERGRGQTPGKPLARPEPAPATRRGRGEPAAPSRPGGGEIGAGEAGAAAGAGLQRGEGGGARGEVRLTRPWHTEQTRGGRSGGAGIAGTDPTAPSYRLTKWRRRPHTSPARAAHWLSPQPGGGESPASPRQRLPLARRSPGGGTQRNRRRLLVEAVIRQGRRRKRPMESGEGEKEGARDGV